MVQARQACPIFVSMSSKETIAGNNIKSLVDRTEQYLQKIYEGGGKKAIAKQKERNKLTARERIAYLIDKNSDFIEIGAFAGFEMYEEQGGCPAGGTVGGIGYVSGRQCVIVANDQTVKAGAWFPITGKKKFTIAGNCFAKQSSHYLPGR